MKKYIYINEHIFVAVEIKCLFIYHLRIPTKYEHTSEYTGKFISYNIIKLIKGILLILK